MTFGDCIRSKTDEELAKMIVNLWFNPPETSVENSDKLIEAWIKTLGEDMQ